MLTPLQCRLRRLRVCGKKKGTSVPVRRAGSAESGSDTAWLSEELEPFNASLSKHLPVLLRTRCLQSAGELLPLRARLRDEQARRVAVRAPAAGRHDNRADEDGQDHENDAHEGEQQHRGYGHAPGRVSAATGGLARPVREAAHVVPPSVTATDTACSVLVVAGHRRHS